MADLVTVSPISKRGKERIAQHGATFELIRTTLTDGQKRILCQSLKHTASDGHGGKECWLGWFVVGIEVSVISTSVS